jgi:DNA-nicking Smr family endonuclease
MAKPNASDEDDIALFRATVGEVTPIPEPDRILNLTPPRYAYLPESEGSTVLPDILSDSFQENPPDQYCSNGISRQSLRKLARGYWPVQDSLDLHGLHSDTARRTLQTFLHQALVQHSRCVLVIHGKGLNSKSGEAILKLRTRHWLIQHPSVLAYCDAPPQLGSSGAAIILLKVNP